MNKYDKNASTRTIVGEIREVRYRKGSFFIAVMLVTEGRGEGKKITIKGNLASSPQLYSRYEATGPIKRNEQYKTFEMKAVEIKFLDNNSVKGIEAFLSRVPGIGPIYANKIAIHWNEKTFKNLNLPRNQLKNELKKIGITIRDSYLDRAVSWIEAHKSTQEIEAMLCGLDVGPHNCRLVIDWLERRNLLSSDLEKTKNNLKKHIYEITEEKGIGFKTASAIGESLGTPENNPARVRAGIIYSMQEATKEGGHVCLTANELVRKSVKLLKVHKNIIIEEMKNLVGKGKLATQYVDPEKISKLYKRISDDIKRQQYAGEPD